MNEHPISLVVTDDRRRSRLTVFFRFLLVLPHFFWLMLWGVTIYIVAPLNWLVALVIGRPAKPFQRYIGAFVRYVTHVSAYMYLIANPFPGFTGIPRSYPVDLEVSAVPEKQKRLVTFFRGILVFPAAILANFVGQAIFGVLFLGWWAALFTGRMPRGMRDLGAYVLRYNAQVAAYYLLLTGRYPNSSPYSGMKFESAPAAAIEVAPLPEPELVSVPEPVEPPPAPEPPAALEPPEPPVAPEPPAAPETPEPPA
jgi:hypothetical protein